jgi:Plasma-membrane choline transporter
LQAVISLVRYVVHSAREHRDRGDACASLCHCVVECILRCMEDIVEQFNQWAYCFVAIYGLSYLESGRKVVKLFQDRGWTAIETFDLAGFTLALATVGVAIGMGLVGMVVERTLSSLYLPNDEADSSFLFGKLPAPQYWAFV